MEGCGISIGQNMISHDCLIITEFVHRRIMDTGLNAFAPQINHQTVPIDAFIEKYGIDMIISGKRIISKGDCYFVNFR